MPTPSALTRTALLLRLVALIAAPHAVRAQVASPQTQTATADVQIQIQFIDVTPDELAKAEQAVAVPPATAASLSMQLETALLGLDAHRLRNELAKSQPNSSLNHPIQLMTHDGIPVSSSMDSTTIIPGGGTVATVTSVSIKPSIQSDGFLAMKIIWSGTAPVISNVPALKVPTVAVAYTVADGRLAAVALPPLPGKQGRLAFLTAWIVPRVSQLPFPQVPGLADQHNPADMNAYPSPGVDPNGMDRMGHQSPFFSDRMNIWPEPKAMPLARSGSNQALRTTP